MGKIKNEMKHLKSGDLKKIATALDVSYQKVREVSSGRVKDDVILETLKKLNEARREQLETIPLNIVTKIINK